MAAATAAVAARVASCIAVEVALVFCAGDCVVALPEVAVADAVVVEETAGFEIGIAGTTLPDFGPACGPLGGVLDVGAATAGSDGCAVGAVAGFCVIFVVVGSEGAVGLGVEDFGSGG